MKNVVFLRKIKIIMKTNIKRAVAYIDILGFKNIVSNDILSAFEQLHAVNSMLNNRFEDYIMYQSQAPFTDPNMIDLQERMLFDSVSYFFPFSDSIFASSDNCDLFVLQLSNLIYELYKYSVNNKFKFPIFYKGGIGYGVACEQSMKTIQKGVVSSVSNIVGQAVIDAVSLESYTYKDSSDQIRKLKGPRLLLKKELYDQLSKTKDYCIPVKESNGNVYEVLWPAYAYIKQAELSQNIQEFYEHFYAMFNNAYCLWRKYKQKDEDNKRSGDNRISLHYEEFIRLIISSTTTYFNRNFKLGNEVDFTITQYIHSIDDKDLERITEYLI